MDAGPGRARRTRARRSVLSVPASNPRFVARAAQTEADAVLFDLEDFVAPAARRPPGRLIVRALNETDFRGKLRVVRINALPTPWAVRDVVDLVEGAGANLDAVVLPKTDCPEDVSALDAMLGSLEAQGGLAAAHRHRGPDRDGAAGMANVEEIARASPTWRPSSSGRGTTPQRWACRSSPSAPSTPARGRRGRHRRTTGGGAYPGHLWHYAVQRIVVTTKAAGLQAINGPYGRFRDLEGLRRGRHAGLRPGDGR